MTDTSTTSTDLPDGWVWSTLGEVVEVLDARRIPVNSSEREKRISGKGESDLYPYFGATGQAGWIDDYIFDGAILLLGEDGAPFLDPFAPKAYTVTGKSWVNNHAHVLRPFPDTIPISYLRYYLDIFDYRDYVTGTTRLKLNQARMSSIPIPLAPLNEQHRIVEAIETYFTRLDAAEAALRRAQARLAQYKSALLRAACEGRLVPTEAELARQAGRTYEPADDLLAKILKERRAKWEAEEWARLVERAKQRALADARKADEQASAEPIDDAWLDVSETAYAKYLPKDEKWKAKYQEPVQPDVAGLPALPEGWCWATVKTVGKVQLGRQRAPQYHSGSHMRPYLRVANVFEDRIDTSDVLEMNFDPGEYEKYRLNYGDILLNEGQSPELLGRPAMFRDEVPNACFQNTLIRFQSDALIDRSYALYLFRSYMRQGRFRQEAQITTNIAHLSAGRFAEIEFPLPPIGEQGRITAELEQRFSFVDALEKSLAANLARVVRLRQAILKRAFSGQLVPQVVYDEPAAALLARIRASRTGDDKTKLM